MQFFSFLYIIQYLLLFKLNFMVTLALERRCCKGHLVIIRLLQRKVLLHTPFVRPYNTCFFIGDFESSWQWSLCLSKLRENFLFLLSILGHGVVRNWRCDHIKYLLPTQYVVVITSCLLFYLFSCLMRLLSPLIGYFAFNPNYKRFH